MLVAIAPSTSRRAASKSRVTCKSRSLGVDILKLSRNNMETLLPLPESGTFGPAHFGFAFRIVKLQIWIGVSLCAIATPMLALPLLSQLAPRSRPAAPRPRALAIFRRLSSLPGAWKSAFRTFPCRSVFTVRIS